MYTIYSPGGNNTALIEGTEYSAAEKKTISSQILQKETDVEQVGFVKFGKEPQLVMAGGEFCGNATRTVAWLACQGKKGFAGITVSGSTSKLSGGVDVNGNAWAEMPVSKDRNIVQTISEDTSLVRMEGIAHIVTTRSTQSILEETATKTVKDAAYSLLETQGLITSEPAAGVMFVNNAEGICSITPVVYVRDIETLFEETACGSGTIAVVIQEAMKQKRNIAFSILQPSGMSIIGSVKIVRGLISRATISGTVKYLRSGKINLAT